MQTEVSVGLARCPRAAASMMSTATAGDGSSEAGFETAFYRLVDQYMDAHPVTSDARAALSTSNIKFAVAKILIRKTRSTSKAMEWPGAGVEKLAAILLTLFVQEHLRHEMPTILGLPAGEFYALIEEIVTSQRISRELLMSNVIAVDCDGRAIDLVGSHAISPLWTSSQMEAASTKRRLHAILESPELGCTTESASVSQLSSSRGSMGADVVPLTLLRKRLSERFVKLRLVVVLVAIAWVLCGPLSWVSTRRVPGLFPLMVVLGNVLVVCSFPTDLTSFSAHQFVTTALVLIATGATIGAYLNFFHRSTVLHVNQGCRMTHAALCCGITVNWWSMAVAALRSRLSWRLYRIGLAADGLLFVTTQLALLALGPPPTYPPGNQTFNAAMLRSWTTLGTSMLLSPDCRGFLAGLANLAGWNHITFTLQEVGADAAIVDERDSDTSSTSGSADPTDGRSKEHVD